MENWAVETLSISGEIQGFNFFQLVESVECFPFSPYCSAMIRCPPPVCKYFCVDCMVRFPRGCRDRSLSRKLSGKVRSFNEKPSNNFWLAFSGKVSAVWFTAGSVYSQHLGPRSSIHRCRTVAYGSFTPTIFDSWFRIF